MSNMEAKQPADNDLPQVSVATPQPEIKQTGIINRLKAAAYNQYTTAMRFILSIQGLLNVAIIIALVCVLISAGVANSDDTKIVDNLSSLSTAKVSAYHTRNADLAFGVIGLIIFFFDTLFYTTGLIRRLPEIVDLITVIIVFVLGAIYLIIGCCSAAWAKKMNDIKVSGNAIVTIGSPVAASFFLFIAMIGTFLNGVLRLIRPRSRSHT